MIIKVQRPIMPPNGDWLAYDETGNTTWIMPPSRVHRKIKKMMGEDYLAYFEAERIDDDLYLYQRVETPNG